MPNVVEESKQLIQRELNTFGVHTDVIQGDSRLISKNEILNDLPITAFQMIILHPPYHDIIRFSDKQEDLSNAKSLRQFLEMFGQIVENVTPLLEDDRYLILVIGDKFNKGEWIPLGHLTMLEVLKKGYMLKSTIVKNIEKTTAKRNQEDLWRYRALAGGFYIFKHEYIFIFKKTNKPKAIDELIDDKN